MKRSLVFVLLFGMLGCQTKPTKLVSEPAKNPTGAVPVSAELAPESAEHQFARQQYEEAIDLLSKLDQQIASIKGQSAGLKSQACRRPDIPLGAEYEAYSDCLDGQDAMIRMRATLNARVPPLDNEKRRLTGTELPILKLRMEYADQCLAIYTTTIDKKASDLTTRETEQLQACRSANLYPPPKAPALP